MASNAVASTPEFSLIVSLGDIPASGSFPVRGKADEAVLEAIAQRLGVYGLSSLSMEAVVSKARNQTTSSPAMRVEGTISARVQQRCVVTLELFWSDLSEPFSVLCSPDAPDELEVGEDGDFDLAALLEEEDIEPLTEAGSCDIGELAVQYLALGIDPNPRAPGVDLPEEYLADEEAGETEKLNPFAVLAKLKQNR
jgi:uncharacterized metal-binding protein YceD (DUF177 family)